MATKEIHELPLGTDYNDAYEFPVSTGVNPGDVKRYTFGFLKSTVMSWISAALTGITQGPQGAAGVQGPQGQKGDTGAKGDKGDQGVAGIKGDQGNAGANGIKGDPGVKGDRGNTGAQGVQGIQGATGAVGATGPAGAAGGNFDMTAYIHDAPVCADEAAAIIAGLDPYTLYKTATGELRYKLPVAGFTYTLPFNLS
jgi:hypothetical protein